MKHTNDTNIKTSTNETITKSLMPSSGAPGGHQFSVGDLGCCPFEAVSEQPNNKTSPPPV